MSKLSPVPEYVIRSDKGEITAVDFGHFLNDGNIYLLTGHDNGYMQIWNLKTYRLSVSWEAHPEHRIKWVSWISDGYIISFGRDGVVKFWEFDLAINPHCKDTLSSTCFSHCHCAVIYCAGVLPKPCHYLGIPQGTAAINVITVLDKKLIFEVPESIANRNVGTLMCFKFIPIEGDLLVVGGYECGSIILWNSSRKVPISILDVYDDPIMCIDLNREFMSGIVGSTSDKLVRFSIILNEKQFELRLEKTVTMTNAGSTCIKIHPQSIYVSVTSWDNNLRIFSWRKMKPLAVLNVHLESIQSLAYGTKGSDVVLAAGSKDGRVSLWNLYNKGVKTT
ncbi:Guanine nucleotide binding protein (G protein), beta polypeptide 1-like [Chamberlinius hualienensis]